MSYTLMLGVGRGGEDDALAALAGDRGRHICDEVAMTTFAMIWLVSGALALFLPLRDVSRSEEFTLRDAILLLLVFLGGPISLSMVALFVGAWLSGKIPTEIVLWRRRR